MQMKLYTFNLEALSDEQADEFHRMLLDLRKTHGGAAVSSLAADLYRLLKARAALKQTWPNIVVDRDELADGKIWVITLLKRAGWAQSSSEGRRLIEQGAVRVTEEHTRICEPEDIFVSDGMPISCGKNKAVVVINSN